MNRYIKILIAVILVGIVVGAVSWKTNQDNDTIHVGVILPLTGQYAAVGESDKNAMLLAKKELRADNIELYFEDDKYDAKTAVSAYHKLKSLNNIDVVVVLSAPSIQSITPLTNADKIPLLGLGTTLVYEKDSVFQLMPAGDKLFSTLGQIYGTKYKKIAVAHSNATLFLANTELFKKGLSPDVQIIDVAINPSTDYRTDVQKILSTRPNAVTLFMPKEDALKFLQALRIQDQKGIVKIVCDFGVELAVDEYTAAIGKDRLEGCVSTNLADTAQTAFKTRYKETYGSDVFITADYAYDAVQLIQQLVRTTPKVEWITQLSSLDFILNGRASGKIQFNEDGTRLDIPPLVNVYRDGKFIPMK